MDASCTIQDSIHVFSLVHKYVSSILGTYHIGWFLKEVRYPAPCLVSYVAYNEASKYSGNCFRDYHPNTRYR